MNTTSPRRSSRLRRRGQSSLPTFGTNATASAMPNTITNRDEENLVSACTGTWPQSGNSENGSSALVPWLRIINATARPRAKSIASIRPLAGAPAAIGGRGPAAAGAAEASRASSMGGMRDLLQKTVRSGRCPDRCAGPVSRPPDKNSVNAVLLPSLPVFTTCKQSMQTNHLPSGGRVFRGLARTLLGLLLVLPFAAAARQDPPPELVGIEAFVERGMRDWGIPGLAVSVVKDDELVWARGFGVRRLGQ